GRFFQEFRRRFEELAILFVIRNDFEPTVGPSPDDSEEPCGSLLFLLRKSRDPRIEFVFGHIVGIEPALRWFLARHSVNERLVLIESRPGPFVDHALI